MRNVSFSKLNVITALSAAVIASQLFYRLRYKTCFLFAGNILALIFIYIRLGCTCLYFTSRIVTLTASSAVEKSLYSCLYSCQALLDGWHAVMLSALQLPVFSILTPRQLSNTFLFLKKMKKIIALKREIS